MTPVPSRCIVCDAAPEPFVANEIPLWKCPSCGLMWRQSFDVPLEHYAEGEGRIDPEKEKAQRRNVAGRIRSMRRYISLDGFCDVGASKGIVVDMLTRAGYKNAIGIEPNTTQVAYAQSRGINVVEGSLDDIVRLTEGKDVQTIGLFHVVEHLPDPEKGFADMYAALPPKGHVVIETPDFNAYVFKRLNYVHKLIYPEHLFYYTPETLSRLLERAGFKVRTVLHRDYDGYHLNLFEALFRLGFKTRYLEGTNPRPLRAPAYVPDTSSPHRPSLSAEVKKRVLDLLSRIASLAVILSGRQNFMLLIAEKEGTRAGR